MIFVSKYMVPNGYTGITLYPFVFVKHSFLKQDKLLVNHERIHLRQQLELLVIPFFVWYGLEFLIRYAKYGNWILAYRNVSFEREAYAHERDPGYLKTRKIWRFCNFL